jgi:NDP-sugar pyrophosphorylase family protein
VKAVVLVGGEGTRLRPLTFTTPKPLLPIANRPHLERQLSWLASHGVDEVVLSLGYLPDAFHEHFPGDRFVDARHGEVVLRYAVEDEPLGTAGAIRFAAEGIEERFVVCNGDVLTDLDLGAMVRFHDEHGAEATIALAEVDDPSAFGVVPTAPDGRVIAFVEKPPPGRAPTNWINAGTYVLERAFLDRIPPRLNVSVERETFPRLLDQPGRLYGFRSDGYWLDIGTPEKYLEAQADVLAGRAGGPPDDASEHSPGVFLQTDAIVEPGATVAALSLVGPGARLESGATVRGSVVGPGVVVERDVLLERVVLHAGARVGHGSVLHDSVLGIDAVCKPEVVLGECTLIGTGVTIASGTRISAGRVPAARD